MATFRGSGSAVNGAAFPTEAALQLAIDEAQAAAIAAAASQALAEINVTESETAQAAAETAQAAAETAIPLAHDEVVLAEAQVVLATQAVTDAEQAVTDAQAEVVLAAAQVTLATAQQVLAEQARIDAETAETGAQTAEDGAVAAQDAAELAFDDFDDRYLGSKASDPTLDNDGDALLTGALYWNTGTPELRIYSGTVWAGVLLESTADTLYQPLDDELSDIAALAPTKGRIIVGNGTAFVDLGVGTNDQVVTADSVESTGVKWATPYAGPGVFSGGQTDWADNVIYTFAHGLGGQPDVVHGFYECVTTDGVWEPGEKVPFTWQYIYSIGVYGGLTWADDTNVGVMSQTNGFYIPAKSGSGTVGITKSKWKIQATAIKF